MNPQPSADLEAPERTFRSPPEPAWRSPLERVQGVGAPSWGLSSSTPCPPRKLSRDSVSPQRRPQSARDGSGCLRGSLNPGNTYDVETDGRSMARMGRLVLTLTEASSRARSATCPPVNFCLSPFWEKTKYMCSVSDILLSLKGR